MLAVSSFFFRAIFAADTGGTAHWRRSTSDAGSLSSPNSSSAQPWRDLLLGWGVVCEGWWWLLGIPLSGIIRAYQGLCCEVPGSIDFKGSPDFLGSASGNGPARISRTDCARCAHFNCSNWTQDSPKLWKSMLISSMSYQYGWSIYIYIYIYI